MMTSEHASPESHVYRRPLPSGGYVAIATEAVQPLFAQTRIRGSVVVERRSEERRVGHKPPIVAYAERDDVAAILVALVPVAESDEILARTLARRVTVPITKRRLLDS